MAIKNIYIFTYITLILAELVFSILLLTPYGDPKGSFASLYGYVRRNLNNFFVIGFIILNLIYFVFPGLGSLSFLIIIYRVAQTCCYNKESFGDGLLYGWGRYHPSDDTVYDQGCLERNNDGTNAAYSSACGDNVLRKKSVLFPTRYNEGSWIIPKIVDTCKIHKPCSSEYLDIAGSVLRDQIRPHGLITTSLLAKQLYER